jgi:hypothetical protein
MEKGLTARDISAGMLGWYTILSTPWFVLVIIQFCMFSADKMLCILVSGMLLLQEVRGNPVLQNAFL